MASMELMEVFCSVVSGSRLYGLEDPQSDRDVINIYIPSLERALLGKAENTLQKKSYSLDNELVDEVWYSLNSFVKRAMRGEVGALDMLHARGEHVLYTTPAWEDLVKARTCFYTKGMRAFVGYARSQVERYADCGQRYSQFVEVSSKLRAFVTRFGNTTLSSIWHLLPSDASFSRKLEAETSSKLRVYDVGGLRFQETELLGDVNDRLFLRMGEYGPRAKKAAEDGCDWKSLCHALRVCYQIQDICELGDYEYPLKQTSYLRGVKAGKETYEAVYAELLRIMQRAEFLLQSSSLPEAVNETKVEAWLLDLLKKHYSSEFGIPTFGRVSSGRAHLGGS